jgi:hypothetical protein
MTTPDRPRHVPRLRFRPTTRRDFPECLELVPSWLTLDATLQRALPDLWLRLLDEPAITTTVMEDLALPAGRRIQGWGWGIVLPEDWVERRSLATRPQAYVTRQIYGGLHDGSLPLMSDAEIGIVNAEGRYHFFNFYTQRHNDLSDPYTQSILTIANDAFRISGSGYDTRAMYFETTQRDAPAIAAAGFVPRRYADESSLEGLAPSERPAFLSVTREEARAGLPGTSVRHVFEHHPPMFRFSAAQRRLLWLALFDDSDAHLTDRLEVSVHGLKKLWRGIYERIEDRMPQFFGDAASDDDGKRGPEKRRPVLAYVRQRPEELRPWAADRTR